MDSLEICGYLFVLYFGIKLLIMINKVLWPFCLGPLMGLNKDPKKLGKWAVITGATDGIGKAYAEEFARRGMSVYLLSRTKSKLEKVAQEIASKFDGAEVAIHQIDYASTDFATYKDVGSQLKELDIGILVNNVGVAPTIPELFSETDRKEIYDSVLVNAMSCIMMAKIVLKGMLERNRGAILNIGSSSALKPVPMLNYYSAAKAFMDFFSRSLSAEIKGSGVSVQSIRPWSVETKMVDFRRYPKGSIPTAKEYVQDSLRTLGLTSSTAGMLRFQLYENLITSELFSNELWYWINMKTLGKCKRICKEESTKKFN